MKTRIFDKSFELDEIDEVAAWFCPKLTLAQASTQVLCFSGELGAGKTTLIAAILSTCFDIPRAAITSPTFTLLNQYEGVFHFDLYRLEDPLEFERMGWDEHLNEIALIEWPERLGPWLPKRRLDIRLELQADLENRRRITVDEIS